MALVRSGGQRAGRGSGLSSLADQGERVILEKSPSRELLGFRGSPSPPGLSGVILTDTGPTCSGLKKHNQERGKGLRVLGSEWEIWAHASRSPCLWGKGSAEHAAPPIAAREPHVGLGVQVCAACRT